MVAGSWGTETSWVFREPMAKVIQQALQTVLELQIQALLSLKISYGLEGPFLTSCYVAPRRTCRHLSEVCRYVLIDPMIE